MGRGGVNTVEWGGGGVRVGDGGGVGTVGWGGVGAGGGGGGDSVEWGRVGPLECMGRRGR